VDHTPTRITTAAAATATAATTATATASTKPAPATTTHNTPPLTASKPPKYSIEIEAPDFKLPASSSRTKTDPSPEHTLQSVGLPKGMRWRKKCPISLDRLSRTAEVGVDFCSVCQKNVYLSQTLEELQSHVAQKHCVVFSPTLVVARKA
jgi:hypothetical protein